MDLSVLYLCDGLDRGSIFDQQLHHLHSVLLTGDVQWRKAILEEKGETLSLSLVFSSLVL